MSTATNEYYGDTYMTPWKPDIQKGVNKNVQEPTKCILYTDIVADWVSLVVFRVQPKLTSSAINVNE